MTTTIKLQKIGNSIRATIPKAVTDTLSLRQGEEMVVDIGDDYVILKKKQQRSKGLSRFYGILKGKTGEVKSWPTPEEIKNIWE